MRFLLVFLTLRLCGCWGVLNSVNNTNTTSAPVAQPGSPVRGYRFGGQGYQYAAIPSSQRQSDVLDGYQYPLPSNVQQQQQQQQQQQHQQPSSYLQSTSASSAPSSSPNISPQANRNQESLQSTFHSNHAFLKSLSNRQKIHALALLLNSVYTKTPASFHQQQAADCLQKAEFADFAESKEKTTPYQISSEVPSSANRPKQATVDFQPLANQLKEFSGQSANQLGDPSVQIGDHSAQLGRQQSREFGRQTALLDGNSAKRAVHATHLDDHAAPASHKITSDDQQSHGASPSAHYNFQPSQLGSEGRYLGSPSTQTNFQLSSSSEGMLPSSQSAHYVAQLIQPSLSPFVTEPASSGSQPLNAQAAPSEDLSAQFDAQSGLPDFNSAKLSIQSASLGGQSTQFGGQSTQFGAQSAQFGTQSGQFGDQSAPLSPQTAQFGSQAAQIGRQGGSEFIPVDQSTPSGSQILTPKGQFAHLIRQFLQSDSQVDGLGRYFVPTSGHPRTFGDQSAQVESQLQYPVRESNSFSTSVQAAQPNAASVALSGISTQLVSQSAQLNRWIPQIKTDVTQFDSNHFEVNNENHQYKPSAATENQESDDPRSDELNVGKAVYDSLSYPAKVFDADRNSGFLVYAGGDEESTSLNSSLNSAWNTNKAAAHSLPDYAEGQKGLGHYRFVHSKPQPLTAFNQTAAKYQPQEQPQTLQSWQLQHQQPLQQYQRDQEQQYRQSHDHQLRGTQPPYQQLRYQHQQIQQSRYQESENQQPQYQQTQSQPLPYRQRSPYQEHSSLPASQSIDVKPIQSALNYPQKQLQSLNFPSRLDLETTLPTAVVQEAGSRTQRDPTEPLYRSAYDTQVRQPHAVYGVPAVGGGATPVPTPATQPPPGVASQPSYR